VRKIITKGGNNEFFAAISVAGDMSAYISFLATAMVGGKIIMADIRGQNSMLVSASAEDCLFSSSPTPPLREVAVLSGADRKASSVFLDSSSFLFSALGDLWKRQLLNLQPGEFVKSISSVGSKLYILTNLFVHIIEYVQEVPSEITRKLPQTVKPPLLDAGGGDNMVLSAARGAVFLYNAKGWVEMRLPDKFSVAWVALEKNSSSPRLYFIDKVSGQLFVSSAIGQGPLKFSSLAANTKSGQDLKNLFFERVFCADDGSLFAIARIKNNGKKICLIDRKGSGNSFEVLAIPAGMRIPIWKRTENGWVAGEKEVKAEVGLDKNSRYSGFKFCFKPVFYDADRASLFTVLLAFGGRVILSLGANTKSFPFNEVIQELYKLPSDGKLGQVVSAVGNAIAARVELLEKKVAQIARRLKQVEQKLGIQK
jgi:hypothetical protein